MSSGDLSLRSPTTRADGSVEADLRDLRVVLSPRSFPTDQDHLIACCLARRVPSRLLRRLGCLNQARTYASVDEVCTEVAEYAAAHHRGSVV